MTRNGIDRLPEMKVCFGGARIGLITGASGVTRELVPGTEVLNENFRLTALFAPEHGVRGALQPGAKVERERDAYTGLPVYSLFEDEMNAGLGFDRENVYMPPEEALALVDMIAFDLQDAGSRYFTYASTMFFAMKACARANIPFVVLDRINPIGGVLTEGNTHREENTSFIGLTRVPIRHAMTMGELARYYQGEYAIDCDLRVVPVDGWTRDMDIADTDLPLVPPSPNLPTMEALTLYNGTCMLAGTNVSEGRGTVQPFEMIGAPYIDGRALKSEMDKKHLPGVKFRAVWFVPQFSKYAGQMCGGVQVHVINRKDVRPVALGVHIIDAIRTLYPKEFAFKPASADGRYHIDLSTGTDEVRLGEKTPEEILRIWQREALAFGKIQKKYALY